MYDLASWSTESIEESVQDLLALWTRTEFKPFLGHFYTLFSVARSGSQLYANTRLSAELSMFDAATILGFVVTPAGIKRKNSADKTKQIEAKQIKVGFWIDVSSTNRSNLGRRHTTEECRDEISASLFIRPAVQYFSHSFSHRQIRMRQPWFWCLQIAARQHIKVVWSRARSCTGHCWEQQGPLDFWTEMVVLRSLKICSASNAETFYAPASHPKGQNQSTWARRSSAEKMGNRESSISSTEHNDICILAHVNSSPRHGTRDYTGGDVEESRRAVRAPEYGAVVLSGEDWHARQQLGATRHRTGEMSVPVAAWCH